MNVHKNAKVTPLGRALFVRRVVEGRESPSQVARQVGLAARTVHKWVARWRAQGEAGLADRSSRPRRSPRRLARSLRRQIERLRHRRWSSLRIAERLSLPVATVVVTQRRLGLARLQPLEPRPPVIRYERARPGELVHLDTKKLVRIGRVGHRIHGDRSRRVKGIGWEVTYAAVDDATRLAYSEVRRDERGETAAAFLHGVVAWAAARGVQIERVMTDNGGAFCSRHFRAALDALGIRHIRTRPYTPRTNGKVERFIQTLLREWAYAAAYATSAVRTRALGSYMRFYNAERRHTALGFQPPLARLAALSEQRPY